MTCVTSEPLLLMRDPPELSSCATETDNFPVAAPSARVLESGDMEQVPSLKKTTATRECEREITLGCYEPLRCGDWPVLQ